ncbi:hypothetical protein QBC44DRAFT_381946 [Cladorrhinum sp. PSN332]|nr:hypothetical protein QBC44DRAFT_381946 [Cladorrhinum sp. PSN332]
MMLRALRSRLVIIVLFHVFSFIAIPNSHAARIPSTQPPLFRGPTTAPPIATGEQDLLRRQYGPMSTCGFISGDASSPYNCDYGSRCVTDTRVSVIFCCHVTISSSRCVVKTACLDRTKYTSSTERGFWVGSRTEACTASSKAYCNVLVFADVPVSGFDAYFCAEYQEFRTLDAYITTDAASITSTSPATTTTSPSPPDPTNPPTGNNPPPRTTSVSTSATGSSPTDEEKPKGKGLNTSDKIALGVGIPCAAAAIAGTIAKSWKHIKKCIC